jgi:RNA polymerase sigma factor (sigma-70 family)
MVAILTRIFGTENLELAEDVVQDTLIQALGVWKLKGVPDNPAGWIMAVARNKAIDVIRRRRHSISFDFSGDRVLLASEYTLECAMDGFWKEEVIPDDMLRMMFACCHPGIPAEARITLILKTLCGFSAAEIAAAFLASEDTVNKRLHRAKEFFRAERVRMEIPPPDDLKERTGAVLNALYLLFNEGYGASGGEGRLRRDLMGEALLLARMVAEHPLLSDPRAWALLALMCFHASRSDGRLTETGAIVPLPAQDRSRWDARLIAEGDACMGRAAAGEGLSPYHLEAAIAYEHCAAASFAEVDWRRILQYYDWLAAFGPNPMVELNRLVAVMQVEGPEAAQARLEALPDQGKLEGYVLYHALRGEIRSRLADGDGAREAWRKAAALAGNEAEKRLLLDKASGAVPP